MVIRWRYFDELLAILVIGYIAGDIVGITDIVRIRGRYCAELLAILRRFVGGIVAI